MDPSLEHFDGPRIGTLLACVREVMGDGAWRTLGELQSACEARGVHGSEAGLSARLRDLRKPECGRLTVERRRRGEPAAGLFEYRLALAPETKPGEQMEMGLCP